MLLLISVQFGPICEDNVCPGHNAKLPRSHTRDGRIADGQIHEKRIEKPHIY